jgi:hypothetical protein
MNVLEELMHHIQLDDHLFQVAQQRAVEAGFQSVDEYVADVLQNDLEDAENLDRFFTPDRLAQIDRAAAQLAAGQGLTPEETDAELARRREEWQRQKAEPNRYHRSGSDRRTPRNLDVERRSLQSVPR